MDLAEQKPIVKWVAIIALILLAVLAAWGSRERHFVQITETWTNEKKELTEQLHKTETEKTELAQSLKKAQRTTKRTVPVVLPNGQIAYVTEETSDTVEEATSTMKRDYASQLDSLKKENADLVTKLHSKTEETTKSAPRWVAGLDIPVFDYANITAYSLLGGINIGPLTVGLRQPFAWRAPTLQAMIRF